jgi:1,6-anhydro-N-acetylmuramate kinase
MPERHIVGMMTGTSCDGCDAALVRLGDLGPPTVLNTVSRGLGELGPALRRIADQGATTTGELAELGRALALVHIHCVRELIGDGPRPDLVAVHGQTLFHRPPLSLQFLPLPILAHELGTTVVGDLRGADLAAGGQGAPITPLADAVCYPGDGPRAVVNLGGFINITLLDGNTVVGGRDLCVGNQLLDRLARMLLGKPYDLDGSVAGSGQADAQACTELGVTLRSQDRGRSLGTGDELLPWVERWGESLTPADVLASACQGLAGAISANFWRKYHGRKRW